MTSIDFMSKDEPNFIWKGLNATLDMGCIIENELPEITANKRYETITVDGRSGELHETFDDYAAYDYPVEEISIPYERLAEVRKWLCGRGKLITHNDADKYRDCICTMSRPIEFESEWGEFYKFSVTFRSQPFRRKVRELPLRFKKGNFLFYDFGDELASPLFEIQASGGDFSLQLGDKKLTVINAVAGTVTVDCEHGKVMQGSTPLFTKGTWLKIEPGKRTLVSSGGLVGGKMYNRSVWL